MDASLQETREARFQVDKITKKFAANPEGPLNGSIHPALHYSSSLSDPFDTHSQVLEGRGERNVVVQEKRLLSVQNTVKVQECRFKDAMKEYESTVKSKYKTGVDVDDMHSVDQLWKLIDTAIEDYTSQSGEAIWGKIRIGFRKLGDGSEAIQGWLGLLPTESEYLSVVCGGLKLILKAASQLRKVADTILKQLHQIPAILSSVQRVLNIYRNSTKLVELSDAIYQSVLVALGRMLEYLRHNACRKVMKAFVKQQSFQSDLLTKIEDIATARDEFNAEAEMCHKEACQRLQDATERRGDRVEDEIANLRQIVTVAQNEQERSSQKIQEYFELMGHNYFELTAEVKELKQRQERKDRVMEYLLELLKSEPKVNEAAYKEVKRLPDTYDAVEFHTERRPSLLHRLQKSKARPSQARRNLLRQLDYDPEVAGQDVVFNSQLGPTLTGEEQERCLYAIKSAALAQWVRSEQSSVLVINGNSSGNISRKSGLSLLCARLVCSLDKIRFGDKSDDSSRTVTRPEIVPLHFFCGQHLYNDGSKTWESPSGVINSLLVQLVAQCKDIDLSRFAASWTKNDMDNSDVDDVLGLFRLSLKQLPSSFMVFCILDAVSFYIHNDRISKPTRRLLEGLVKLSNASKKSTERPVFKLLLTAPSRLRTEELNGLSQEQVLNVPKTLPNTGGFSAMKWDRAMRPQLEDV